MPCTFNYYFLLLMMKVCTVTCQFNYNLPELDGSTPTSILTENMEGDVQAVPRGIYHYSDTERDMSAKFKVPELETIDPLRMISDLMGAAVSTEQKRKSMTGVSIPVPIGGRPMNLQMGGDFRSSMSLAPPSSEKKHSSRTVGNAFSHVREVCLHEEAASCDEALDTYHQLKYGKSLLVTSAEDLPTSLANFIVPSLQDKLREMKTQEETDSSVSRHVEPSRNVALTEITPFRRISLPARTSTQPTGSKIKQFLRRIS